MRQGASCLTIRPAASVWRTCRWTLIALALAVPLPARAEDPPVAPTAPVQEPAPQGVAAPPVLSDLAAAAHDVVAAGPGASSAGDEADDAGLSPLSMFRAADPLVKIVMVGLLLASFATWTSWLAKTLEMAAARRRAGVALAIIRSARTLREASDRLAGQAGPAALMARAAAEETVLSEAAIDQAGGGGLKERVASALGRIEAFAGRRMARGTGLLATVGSTAPFVGLFGTVWGIMNAFIGISRSGTTSLAVVAPGIAEALLATAIGLFAAIPAVVIYNFFARSLSAYRALLADAAAGVERLVSRDLDFRAAGGLPARLRLPAAAE